MNSTDKAIAFATAIAVGLWCYDFRELQRRQTQSHALLSQQEEAFLSLNARRWPLIQEAVQCATGTCSYLSSYLPTLAWDSNKPKEDASILLQKHQEHHEEAVAAVKQHKQWIVFILLTSLVLAFRHLLLEPLLLIVVYLAEKGMDGLSRILSIFRSTFGSCAGVVMRAFFSQNVQPPLQKWIQANHRAANGRGSECEVRTPEEVKEPEEPKEQKDDLVRKLLTDVTN